MLQDFDINSLMANSGVNIVVKKRHNNIVL